jgi:hypothetical protein
VSYGNDLTMNLRAGVRGLTAQAGKSKTETSCALLSGIIASHKVSIDRIIIVGELTAMMGKIGKTINWRRLKNWEPIYICCSLSAINPHSANGRHSCPFLVAMVRQRGLEYSTSTATSALLE